MILSIRRRYVNSLSKFLNFLGKIGLSDSFLSIIINRIERIYNVVKVA